MTLQILLVALGGALGAVSRFLLSGWANKTITLLGFMPAGTLLVNIIGSAIMGLLYGLIVEKGVLPDNIKPLLMAGFLGAFTTFSTFSLEAVNLIEQGYLITSACYVLANVCVSILLLLITLSFVRLVF